MDNSSRTNAAWYWRRVRLVAGLGLLTECGFAAALHFGETPDVNQGDLAGTLGWLVHLPGALVYNWLSPVSIYSDQLTVVLFLLGCLQWALVWAYPLILLSKFAGRDPWDKPAARL